MCLIIKTNEVQTNQIKLIMRNKSISINCYNFLLIIIKSDLQMRSKKSQKSCSHALP